MFKPGDKVKLVGNESLYEYEVVAVAERDRRVWVRKTSGEYCTYFFHDLEKVKVGWGYFEYRRAGRQIKIVYVFPTGEAVGVWNAYPDVPCVRKFEAWEVRGWVKVDD